jgi:hypothetical protein
LYIDLPNLRRFNLGKLQEVFGKESGIRQSDIQLRIIENELEESRTIEYKTVGKATVLDDALTESVLIKPLVSFLNTVDHQSSLLVLGITAKQHIPTEIEPVPESILSTERLGSLVLAKIGAIPALERPPNFRFISTKCGSRGYVHLIELNDWQASGYFSRVTNLSYVRHADSSEQLGLPEFMALASRSAGSAAMLVLRGVQVKTQGDPPRTSYTIDIACENHGVKPASFVGGFVEIKLVKTAGVKVTADGNQFVDVTHVNPGRFKIYSYNVNQENNWPIYPDSPIVLGTVTVDAPGPVTFELHLSANDGDGRTFEVLRVTPKGRVRRVSSSRKSWG